MIERMRKLLVMGPENRKEEFLARLQGAGIVQVEPYRGAALPVDGRHVVPLKADLALSAYRTLQRYQKQAHKEGLALPAGSCELTPQQIVDELPQLEDRIRILRDKIQQLSNKRESIEPWGDFDLATLDALRKQGRLTIQFWEVAHAYADNLVIEGAIAVCEVTVDPERRYFLTFSDRPLQLADCLEIRYDEDYRTLTGRIDALKKDFADTTARIYAMIGSIDAVFRHYLHELDLFHYGTAAWGTVKLLDDAVFVLQAWCPAHAEKELATIAAEFPIQVEEIAPDEGERVPTFMANEGVRALGEDLVRIYDTPAYRDWDPSAWIFFSFLVFYSMIFGDAGYALTLIALLLWVKHKVKSPAPGLSRFLNLSLALSGGALVYGLLTGGFYGFSGDNPLFGWVVRLALINTDIRQPGVLGNMMTISIVLGLIHITVSLLLKSFRSILSLKDIAGAIPNLAWIPGIWAFYAWVTLKETDPTTAALGLNIFYGAVGVVFLTSAASLNPLRMLFRGFLGVYNGVQFFADILSYLRIFALGLSGALIAQNFNMLAMMVWDAGPLYFTIIPATLIFVAGHALNIALCIMGGVIHGLRLNFLEWYRWCFDGGGRPFKAFKSLLTERT